MNSALVHRPSIHLPWRALLGTLLLLGGLPPGALAGTLTPLEVAEVHAEIDTMVSDLQRGRVEPILDKTHPALFELVGGREAFVAVTRQSIEEVLAAGVIFVSSENGPPTETYLAGKEELCFVPRTSIMEIQGQRVRSVTFMIAVRPKEGGEWKYLDGSGLRRTPELLKMLFPDLDPSTPLPPNTLERL
jgi:hypothetical protein